MLSLTNANSQKSLIIWCIHKRRLSDQMKQFIFQFLLSVRSYFSQLSMSSVPVSGVSVYVLFKVGKARLQIFIRRLVGHH